MSKPKKIMELAEDKQQIDVYVQVDVETDSNGEITNVTFPKKKQNDELDIPKMMDASKFPETTPLYSKYKEGDMVEVHGLPECVNYMMYGKVYKVLENFTYAIHGMSYPVNKSIIGHSGRLCRTFHESNLRLATVTEVN